MVKKITKYYRGGTYTEGTYKQKQTIWYFFGIPFWVFKHKNVELYESFFD